jgi:hypothetical protein
VLLFLSATISVVAVALGVAAFAVPYMRNRREWYRASPEAREANLKDARKRTLAFIALLLVAVSAVVAIRALNQPGGSHALVPLTASVRSCRVVRGHADERAPAAGVCRATLSAWLRQRVFSWS